MEKTYKDETTPGGSLGLNLENPPSKEAGLMDSGGGQPLLVGNVMTNPITTIDAPSTQATQDRTPKQMELHKLNYYIKWQKETKARKELEQTVTNLQQHILKLKKDSQY